MRKTLFLNLFILLFIFNLNAQEYFQQKVNYKIDVKLDDIKHELSAFEEIEYTNNSPNELRFIYFHIWPNAYKNNNTALAKQKLEYSYKKLFTIEEQRGYIDSLDFKVNGEKVKWEYDKEHIDICKIILPKPLKPGQTIKISTPFHVKLPKGVTSRLGHIKESYQITQWFPKPAVYDKYGWHQFPYINMGEFYYEYGSFDVSITLPKNYIVGATGDLQNPEEIEWLNKLAEKTAKIEKFETTDSFPPSSKEWKTLRYTQKNVHDFAWFADKRFNVLKGEREMPHTGNKVTCWAMFLNREAHLWKKSIEYISDALYYYSKWYGDYPYKQCTAVHSALTAGGGMEYPNITVIGNSGSDMQLEVVIMHEVGHNWFYGMFGFNEREFPWQDEGINSFSEARYMHAKYKNDAKLYKMIDKEKITKLFGLNDYKYKDFHYLLYLISARYNNDQSASLRSEEYTGMNYGVILYHKVSRIFDHLYGYLGEEKFNDIMLKFYNDWKYKHPYPEDVRKAFEEGTGENLSWIFDDLLKTNKKLDYKLIKLKNNNVIVKNNGMINAPFSISGVKNNETVFTKWYQGFDGKNELILPDNSGFDKLVIDIDQRMPEFKRNNNYLKSNGLLKKVEPIRIKPFGIGECYDKTSLYLAPVMGWNTYNNYMLGVLFYNSMIPRNLFEYQIMPMYSFGTNDLAGQFKMQYHILPYKSLFQQITISISGLQYAYNDKKGDNFNQIKSEINFNFRKKNALSRKNNKLWINTIYASDIKDIISKNDISYQNFYNFGFTHTNNQKFFPYSYGLQTQFHKDFSKLSFTMNSKYIYGQSQFIKVRLFAGTFLNKSSNYSPIYNYNLSGKSGINDYTYEHIFLGRFEPVNGSNLLGNQVVYSEGGFSSASAINTSEWLTAINISATIPGLSKKINLQLYGNIAYWKNSNVITNKNFAWEAGAKYGLFNNVLVIYLPLISSDWLEQYNESINQKYYERIRFSINLYKLNPFKILERNFQ